MAKFSDLFPAENGAAALGHESQTLPYRHPRFPELRLIAEPDDQRDPLLLVEPDLRDCAECGERTHFAFVFALLDDGEARWHGWPLCSEECVDGWFAKRDAWIKRSRERG